MEDLVYIVTFIFYISVVSISILKTKELLEIRNSIVVGAITFAICGLILRNIDEIIKWTTLLFLLLFIIIQSIRMCLIIKKGYSE